MRDDIVRSNWEQLAHSRNDYAILKKNVTKMLPYQRAKKGTEHALDKMMSIMLVTV